MKLELQVSERMTRKGENDTVRLSTKDKVRLKATVGKHILLDGAGGLKFKVIAEDAYLEDIVKDPSTAYVSQEAFDRLVGNPIHKEVTLGCDPEFVFLDARRRVLPASYWLPMRGQIGSDGPLAELRPSPATHEREVVENLRQLIKRLPQIVQGRFGGTTMASPEGHSCWQNYALGFHIHLGAPRELITYAAPKTRQFLDSFVTVLDYFVGIPAMLLEDTNVRRLGDGQYGKAGDYRVSTKTIEYRTPGGYHLRHPQYAAGIMALALCVGRDVLEDTAKLSKNWKHLDRYCGYERFVKKYSLPQKSEIRWVLADPSKRSALQHIPNMVEQLQKIAHFEDHAESIRTYFGLILGNKQFSPNLLENW